MISIAFNIGVGDDGFRGSTFLKRLNAGNRAGCAEAIMFWTKNKELISRRTAERDQFLTPYSVRAPKARSTDAKPVTADVFVVAPAVPTRPVEVVPLPAPSPAAVEIDKIAPEPLPAPAPAPAPRQSVGNWLYAKLVSPFFGG